MFPEPTIRAIFMNTQELHDLHKVLKENLQDRIEKWLVHTIFYLVWYNAT